MTLFNVHIYREMRLFFSNIDATTPQEAAAKARDLDTADADDITSCDGQTIAALIDVVGDDEFTHSVIIDFEHEQMRKAAPQLLEALHYLLEQTVDMDLKYGITLTEGEEDARTKALGAIAQATAAQPARRPA